MEVSWHGGMVKTHGGLVGAAIVEVHGGSSGEVLVAMFMRVAFMGVA